MDRNMAFGIVLFLALLSAVYIIKSRRKASEAEVEYIKENGFGVNGDSTPGDDFTR